MYRKLQQTALKVPLSTNENFIFFCLLAIFLPVAMLAQPGKDVFSVVVSGKAVVIQKNKSPFVNIDSICFNAIAPSSQQVIFNDSDSTVVELYFPQVPEFNMINGAVDHTVQINIVQRNGSFHLFANTNWASTFTIHLKDSSDHYFGLTEGLFPDNKKSPDLRGQTIDVEVDGQMFGVQENFSSVWSSFYFNPKGYASFINSFSKGRYQLAVNGETRIDHETGSLDWYLFTGDHNKIYQEYYAVIGAPKFVPLWSCGPMIWRDENKGGSRELIADATNFSRLKIPFTSLMIDRPYSNGVHRWSKMDFDSSFANPGKWIKTLDDSFGVKLITWIAPATFGDRDFPALLPGSFGYLDLSNPAAISEFSKRLNVSQYAYGVKGHKMDRADEGFPEQEAWFDGTAKAARKNKYPYLYARITDSLVRKALGSDHFNYARAAYHGSQRYLSGIWGGDPRSSWDGMAANMANAVRASFMGFSNWGTDVGGYLGPTGKIPDLLYIRWLQWGVFNGIFEIKMDGSGGAGEDRAPWHCSQLVQQAFKRACDLRMQWMPHIFSQLNTAGRYGTLMKPLAMVFPQDANTYAIWDEYIFGNTLLVAPVFTENSKRNVYLPQGEWIDYYTLEKLHGAQTITVDVPVFRIPLYIRSNSFQLTGNIYEGSMISWRSKPAKQVIDIAFYPGDDDANIDFVDAGNNNKQVVLSATISGSAINLQIPAISYEGKVKIFSKRLPLSVLCNGKPVRMVRSKNYLTINRKVNAEMNLRIVFPRGQ